MGLYSLSSIGVGETVEMRLVRRVPVMRTYQSPNPETRHQRCVRWFLRRPQPTHDVTYEDHTYEDTGKRFLVVGVEDGIEVSEMPVSETQ